MVSIKTINEIVYSGLSDAAEEDLEAVHEKILKAVLTREGEITDLVDQIAENKNFDMERILMKRLREVSDVRAILKSVLTAIEKRLAEFSDDDVECEDEEFGGFSVPAVPDSVMFM